MKYELMKKQQAEIKAIKELELATFEKHKKEWHDLYKQCEESGGHVSDNGFMYDTCVKCGYSDGC